MEWNEVKDKFRQIVKGYEGEITEFPQSIDITSRNEITDYDNNGKACKKEKLECSVYAQKLCVGIVVAGVKRSGSKSAGEVKWDFTEEVLMQLLEYFGFKKKETEQLSMFDT